MMWGKQTTFKNPVITLKQADPVDGCMPYSYSPPKTPTGFVVDGLTKCPLSNLIHNAQTHNAQAVFIVNSDDRDIQEVSVPDHIAGVQIHVFLVSKKDGSTLKTLATLQGEKDTKLKIDFLEVSKRNQSINLEIVFTPDDEVITKLLADIYQSSFYHDYVNNDLNVEVDFTMLHCTACQEKGFTMAKDNCLSGGRYCMKSSYFKDLSGEVMLVQTLKHICMERVLESSSKKRSIAQYWWTFHNSCMKEFRPECSNAILKSLGIKSQVFDCVKNSFEQTATNLEPAGSPPKILLQDNSILRDVEQRFVKVEHFANFPLIKVNGMVFYGQADFQSVMGFVCAHLKDNLRGCSEFSIIREVQVTGESKAFKYIALSLVVILLAVIIWRCRQALKVKFEGELAYKIDQSVNDYLKKTGGTDL